MAQLLELETALKNAHKAGDVGAARVLANEILRVRGNMDRDMKSVPKPTDDMSGFERFAAGYGKALPDMARGTEQFFREITPGVSDREKELRLESTLAKERDADLLNTTGGMWGNIGGNAALAAPTMMIPGANTYTGAALTGAALGALQPVGEDESRLLNSEFGAAAGVAGQALGRGIGRILRPVQSELSPAEAKLAQEAAKEGIPLTAGDVTGSKPLKWAESVMRDLPLTGDAAEAAVKGKQQAFTAAALRRAGIEATEASPEILGTQKQALGGTLREIAERNVLDMDQTGVASTLKSIAADATDKLHPDDAARVAHTVKQILAGQIPAIPEQQVASSIVDEFGAPLQKIVEAAPGKPMPGTLYQAWREPLRDMAKKGDAAGRFFGKIRSALDSGFSSGLTGDDAEAFRAASRKYANLKTLMAAAGGGGGETGMITPNQLATALRQNFGKEGVALGRGDLNTLSKAGKVFLREPPQSGTAPRKFYMDLMTNPLKTSMGGAAIGSAVGATNSDDRAGGVLRGGAAGAAIGAAGPLVLPKIIQQLMNSPGGQKYLTEGIKKLSPQQIAALSNLLRTGAISATPQYQIQ